MKKLKAYLAHYFFGLATSCWNAGINALKINSGLATAAALAPASAPHIDLRTMVSVFAAAAVWEAIDYFDDNRLPTNLDALTTTVTARASVITSTAAAQ